MNHICDYNHLASVGKSSTGGGEKVKGWDHLENTVEVCRERSSTSGSAEANNEHMSRPWGDLPKDDQTRRRRRYVTNSVNVVYHPGVMNQGLNLGSVQYVWRGEIINPTAQESHHQSQSRRTKTHSTSLLSMISKLFDSMKRQRQLGARETKAWIHEYQHGFRRSRSAVESITRHHATGSV